MKVKTHVKIAELAFSNNTNNIPKGFSKFMFNFGLTMTDSSWHVKTHPHYMQKSLKYIIEKIEKLLLIKKFNGYYSMQLGIIVHYLCDFCCNAHKLGSVGNITYHVRYERELQKYLLNNFEILKEHFNKSLINKSSILNSFESIKDSIENKLDSYLKGDMSYILDITYSVDISSMVCCSIFAFNESLGRNIVIPAKQF
ncbi:MAG: zinc dependent phospholipase C family protein [Clostridiaceae bacterium]